MPRCAGLVLGLLLSSAVRVAAQVPPPPPPPPLPVQGGAPRDRVAPPKIGTGIIKGRVVDGTTGAPIARARVRLMSGAPRPSAYTDASGSFGFTQLPVGNYSFNAEKSTYLPGLFPEPGRTVRSFPIPRVLREGQVMDDVVIRLYHGAAIAGRVVDAQGDPVESANVRAVKLPPSGRGKPQIRNSSSTNDIGEFRIARLEPGSYLLSVVPQRVQGDDPSVAATPPPQPAPTYFPNAMAIDQAQPIVIERGQTVGGIEIALNDASPVFVSGIVIASDGQPLSAGGFINARSASKDVTGFVDNIGGQGIRPDGTFRMQLPPGDYTLDAQASPSQQATEQIAVSGSVRMESMLVGSARVSVGADNIDGLTIVVGRGAIATGRMVFDGSAEVPANKGDLQIGLFQQDGIGCRAGRTVIAADWTFRVEGLMGACNAQMQGLGRWMVKAVIANDEDLLKTPHTFEAGQTLRNVQVVFTDRRSEISVRVADDTGQTTQEYVALVFPVLDKGAWTTAAQQVRIVAPRPPELVALLRSVQPPSAAPRNPAIAPQPSQEKIAGLRPGEYYAVAVDDLANELSRDPAVLERLAASATRVTLGDGASIEVPLRRIKFAEAMK